MKLFDIFSKKDTCVLLKYLHEGQVTKYTLFRNLLSHNYSALNKMADMEQMFYSGRPFSLASAMIEYQELYEAVLGSIYTLNRMSGDKYSGLAGIFQEIDTTISNEFNQGISFPTKDFVLSFEDITPEMRSLAGAKAANLASIQNTLKLPVPSGFVITAYAFRIFLEETGLAKSVEQSLPNIQIVDSTEEMKKRSAALQEMVMQATVPSSFAEKIIGAYGLLEKKTHKDIHIAMRSSAIGEDTSLSFAGQYETVLNVTKDTLIDAYKAVIASKYSVRALHYRMQYGLPESETPMAVIGLAIVDAAASGVVYTADLSATHPNAIQVSSVWGLGEQLVSGSASPDIFLIDRETKEIIGKSISRKDQKRVLMDSGGIQLADVPEDEKLLPSLGDENVLKLVRYALQIEGHFGSPQDIEWTLDTGGNLQILQSRPLHIPKTEGYRDIADQVFPDNPVLLKGGKTASSGISTGSVFIMQNEEDLNRVPENSIVVAKTASPDYAGVMGRIRGIITDIGSVTSHMSSVAREFGVPAIVDAQIATVTLKQGEIVTMVADRSIIYKGIVKRLAERIKPVRLMLKSPVYTKMGRILNSISPLNLTDPHHSSFAPEGCKTIHDIIRFTHEYAMKEMFGLADTIQNEEIPVKLTSNIPLNVYLIDLGGGLKEGLTTCNLITPDLIVSIPMKFIWKGLSHPGVDWSSAVHVGIKDVMALIGSSATSEVEEQAGNPSYCILAKDYCNFSIRFGYHLASIDVLCGEISDQNYLSIQFQGGAGSYYGRSLRIQFLDNVLKKLGFEVAVKGDLLEASLLRYDRQSMEEKLDHLGRLLGSSRLLDVALRSQEEVERFTGDFFKGDYDFLSVRQESGLHNFYIHGGYWNQVVAGDHVYCVHDGSKSGFSISSGIAGIMGKIAGTAFQDFLDTVKAYHFFPIAIAKNSEISEGIISVQVQLSSGNIARAGGIAFGIRNTGSYFVFRVNALKDNVMIYEYINNKRFERFRLRRRIDAGLWYRLKVEIQDTMVNGFLNDELVAAYKTDKTPEGFVGLWTRADSVTSFDELTIVSNNRMLTVGFD
jgi:pyruvate, water dikinase